MCFRQLRTIDEPLPPTPPSHVNARRHRPSDIAHRLRGCGCGIQGDTSFLTIVCGLTFVLVSLAFAFEAASVSVAVIDVRLLENPQIRDRVFVCGRVCMCLCVIVIALFHNARTGTTRKVSNLV